MKTLSLQGGGTRGIMQAVILAGLEASWRDGAQGAVDGASTAAREARALPVCQRFGLIGGTSVGAIVGGCLAAGVPATDLIKFFTESAPKIFRDGWWLLPRLWHSAKYDPAPLRAALLAVVGNRTLADCKTRFIGTGFEMTTGRVTYFQSYGASSSDENEIIIGPDSGMLLVDVMLASSAAQSYFPGHAWQNYLFWDGGSSGFNAPDMLVFREVLAISPGEWSTTQMLSLGNGNTPWPYIGKDMTDPGIATIAAATFDIAYSGPETSMVWLAKAALGNRHVRLNPEIPNYAIDDASPDTLAGMQAAAGRTLANRAVDLALFTKS